MAFLSEDKIFQDVKLTLWGIAIFLTFKWVKLNVLQKTWSEHWTYPFPNTYE